MGYENPYTFKGSIKLKEPQLAPKYICTDRFNGTRKDIERFQFVDEENKQLNQY